MKIKNITIILLVALIGASCAPVSKVVPTPTSISTSTFMPALTAVSNNATLTPTTTPQKLENTPEQYKSFFVAHSPEEAEKNCRITDAEIADWIKYAKLNDATGDFNEEKVLYFPIFESTLDAGGPNVATDVFWQSSLEHPFPEQEFADPETRPFKRVAFCTIGRDYNDGTNTIKWTERYRLIKYRNPSGHISWYVLRGVGATQPERTHDFPVIEWYMESALSNNNPEAAAALRRWIAAGVETDFPAELEDAVLYEVN